MAAVALACVKSPDGALPHRVDAFFQRLGDDIAAALGDSREAVCANLEQVALAKLAAHNPSAHITHADLIDYVLGADQLCKQADLDGRFAEPPLSLYRGEHFDVSALTWLDGTTSIHQHAFCGAFHVLQGSSIHSRYRFRPWSAPEYKQRAIAGELDLLDIEVLRPGDSRAITRGDALIHSLFHMIRPSVTIVIRTITDDPQAEVQYDYRWPGLAHDPFQRHAPTIRKLQYLRMLRVLDTSTFEAQLARVLPTADLFLAYSLVSERTLATADLGVAHRLAGMCTQLPVSERNLLIQTAHNDLDSHAIIDFRRKLHQPEHRFLLALLLNVFDRGELLRLLRREVGCDDPVAQVCTWIAEFSGNTERFPNLIGIDFNATALEMLACMFAGLGLAATLSRFAQTHGRDVVDGQRDALSSLYLALKQCALFRAVFADLPTLGDESVSIASLPRGAAVEPMFGNLRLVATDKLSEYRANTDLFGRLGNEAFAEAIRQGTATSSLNVYQAPWLLYHSWRQPSIAIDAQRAALVRELMAGSPATPDHRSIIDQVRELGWCDEGHPVDIDELVKRTDDSFIALQNPYELKLFLQRVRELQPRVVVEIGTARGGMLFCLSQLASRDALLVSIDLPGAPNCGGQTAVERDVFSTFGPLTQNFHFIPDDSHLPSSKHRLQQILAGRSIDLLFIDGDHSYAGCLADFETYQDLVGPSGIIAFHDICLFEDQWHGVGVGLVWQELKARYGGEEIIDPDGVTTPHPPAGQHPRWGIGLIQASRIPR